MEAKKLLSGIILALSIAIPSFLLVRFIDPLKIIGAPIIAIIAGMAVGYAVKGKDTFKPGLSFSSKYILQFAVVLLGFGLNIATIGAVGLKSLPIIVCTISASLIVAYVFYRITSISSKTTALVGVGSSICGGSAIAATAPVVKADNQEVAQAISVIFFFNVIAALIFPTLGTLMGMSDEGFAMFAGTAINDTSSVTAAASTWDAMHGTGHTVLDSAIIVKLTRTLFIIPIIIALSIIVSKKSDEKSKMGLWKSFPKFILFFLVASIITSVTTLILSGDSLAMADSVFAFLKQCSSFLIVVAMAAIGLGTDIVKLVKTGSKPLAMGFCCWIAIIFASLGAQVLLGIW